MFFTVPTLLTWTRIIAIPLLVGVFYLGLKHEVQNLVAAKETGREETRGAEVLVRQRASPSAPAVVNAETLGHLEELGSAPGFVEKLIGVFLADNAALLPRIEQALAGRNFHEFRSLVHALKGSSASMGTDRLTRACGSLSALSDAELRLQSPGLLRALHEEMAAARAHLEGYVRERQQSAS